MFPIPQVFCQKEKGHPSVFMDHPNCIAPNGKSVFIKLTVRLIKLRSGHVIVHVRKAIVENKKIRDLTLPVGTVLLIDKAK